MISASTAPLETASKTVLHLNSTETATSFIDSVGINMHSGMSSLTLPYAYRDAVLVENSLKYLHITHIRDGIGAGFGKLGYDYTTTTETYLAERGYKFDFPISTLAPYEVKALQTFASRFPGALESVEGPNEANSWGIDGAKAFQKSLFGFVHGDPFLKNIKVMDFTLAYATTHYLDGYGDLSSISDEGNVHIYGTYGRSPASFGTWLSVAQAATPDHKMNVTETGYSTLPSNAQWGVDEATQAKYILNTLMDAAENNVSMTYLYELLDRNVPNPSSPIQEHYGLFRADGTPKPAADAVHNLMTILETGSSEKVEPGQLDVTFNKPLDKGVHTLLIQKSAGTYDLVLWAEPNIWDPNKQTAIQASKIAVDLSFAGATTATLYDPLVGTAPLRVFGDPRASSLIEVSDHPVIIEVTLGPIVHSVVQTRTNGLVTKEVSTYAPNVSEISVTKTFNSIGLLTSETQLHADRSKDVYHSAIVGKSYVAEHDVYNAAGTLIEATRTHADASLDYHYRLTANGTKITDTYDAAGLQKSHVELRTDGYTDTITFKDGVVSRDVVKFAAGGTEQSETKVYADVGGKAVLTQDTLVHADGSKDVTSLNLSGKAYNAQHDSYDANGTLIHQTRTFAGHEFQTFDLASDGTKTTDTYDASGQQLLHTQVRTNGASDTLTYKNGVLSSEVIKFAPGGTQISETKLFAAIAGVAVMTSDSQVHADGTKDIYTTPADASASGYVAKHTAYDAAGKVLFTDQANLDGSHTQTAWQGGVTLISTAGVADVFKSQGNDTFVFAEDFGHDVVSGFRSGSGSNHDVLVFDAAQVRDFADMQSHLSASGRDTLIDLGGGDSILLKGVAPGALTIDDFHFLDHGTLLA